MDTDNKLGFWGLTALVFGLMVGVGIYNLPQNLASSAAPGSVIVAWAVTAVGILPLVIAFKWLSEHYPQYNAGIYQYAQAAFGNYTGFNVAWGYWLCAAFSNVTYGVMLSDSVGAFWPPLLRHSWEMIVFVSALIWFMYWIVARGIETAKTVNTLLAAVKVIMLVFIITVFIIFFRLHLFDAELWTGHGLGNVWDQVKNSMMVTLFCFFGVEGAVMLSARARRPSDVGKAGVAGFFIALVLYIAVSTLCYGLMARARLAGLQDPSIAYLLRDSCGEWAYWFVISAVIISLLGGWVAWTLVVAQVPYEAAKVGILPRWFLHENRRGMPSFGLMASSIAMEAFLFIVAFADNVYMAALHITGLMIIPAYLFTGLFLMRQAASRPMRWVGALAALFCVWMAYAGGLVEMLATSVFYLAGIGFYIKAEREKHGPDARVFTPKERTELWLLAIASVVSIPVFFLW